MVALELAPVAAAGRRLRYQDQDSAQTLAEGLAEYYAANAGRVARPQDLPAASRELFESHDICHVIFGLDTTLADEAVVDTRTLLSCDVGFAAYWRYLRTDAEAKAIFASMGAAEVVLGTLGATPRLLRGLAAAWRQKRLWPWRPPAAFHDRTLGELRAAFGIRVL
jgi:hypothetical protein